MKRISRTSNKKVTGPSTDSGNKTVKRGDAVRRTCI
jgi:hypothetical protein